MKSSSAEHSFSPLDLSARPDKVRSMLLESQSLVVTDPSNVQWLTGFTGSNSIVYLDHERFVLLTDQRYQEQGPLEVREAQSPAEISISKNLIEDVSKLARARIINLDANLVSWETVNQLKERTGTELISSSPLKTLRAQKDQFEVERISLAAKIADKALTDTIPLFSENVSEMDVAAFLDNKIRQHGAAGNAYKTIVASGVNSSKPHALPTTRRIVQGDLLIVDVGAVVDGYRSDMTRTFVIGEPSKLQQEYLTTVLEAQEEAVRSLEPDMPCDELDRRCRSKIEEAGWGESFIHGTGHGVGLDIHESPAINGRSEEKLMPGMVVTIEPGIYFTDTCGVRWEDLYEITETGARRLTLSAKSPQA